MPAITTIKLRRDTAANWATTNPVLAAGEQGYETDTGLIKVGDGTSAWDALAYQSTARLVQPVKNSSGATINKGSVVYISGANGDNALISLSDADAESTSSKTLGLVNATVANNGFVDVISEGIISGVNTASATAGQSVWLSSTAGQFIFNAPPAKPAHSVYLGVVLRAHATQGEILVKVQNGYELNELHDVNAGSPSTGDALIWNGTAWVNQQVDVSGAIDTHNADTTSVHGIADTSLLATKAYADNAASVAAAAIVDAAPATLDTLNELAAAIGDDANYAATVTTALGTKAPTANPNFTGTVSGITKSMVGLANVDNTSDANKPVSSATQTALNLKANLAGPTFSGNVTLPSTTSIGNVSATELGYLDGVTSAIQTQLGNKQGKVTNVSDTEIGYLDGVTSAIQTQLDAKASTSSPTISNPQLNISSTQVTQTISVVGIGLNSHPDVGVLTITDYFYDTNSLNDGDTFYFSGTPSSLDNIPFVVILKIDLGDQLIINIQTINSSDNATVEAWSGIDFTGNINKTTISTKTVSATEVGYLDGVTSAIQTQLDAKAPKASPAFTGVPTAPTASAGTNTTQVATTAFVSTAVANIVDAAPTALNTLNELAAALGDDANYAATVTTALSNKQDKVSGVSDTEIGYLANVTSDIQAQIDAAAGGGAEPATPTTLGTVHGDTTSNSNESASLGYGAVAAGAGVAIGNYAQASLFGTALGRYSEAAEGGIAIGAAAQAGEYAIAIGTNSPVGANEIIIGVASNSVLRIPGLGIDTTQAADGQILVWNSALGTYGRFEWQTPSSGGGGGFHPFFLLGS